MAITNTAKNQVRPDWLFGGNPDAIRAQEALGQQELVNSAQLPTLVRGDKAKLEAAGVVFGDPCEGDPLFCEAWLPAGWQKKPTEHAMWSTLVDADGKERASIFYKAAFYDRSAFINVAE
jgi:hypothetical protein